MTMTMEDGRRGGMLGCLRSIARGVSSRSNKDLGAMDTKDNGKAVSVENGSNRRLRARDSKEDAKRGGGRDDDDSGDGSGDGTTPLSQSSFFSDRTVDASGSSSSAASTPLGSNDFPLTTSPPPPPPSPCLQPLLDSSREMEVGERDSGAWVGGEGPNLKHAGRRGGDSIGSTTAVFAGEDGRARVDDDTDDDGGGGGGIGGMVGRDGDHQGRQPPRPGSSSSDPPRPPAAEIGRDARRNNQESSSRRSRSRSSADRLDHAGRATGHTGPSLASELASTDTDESSSSVGGSGIDRRELMKRGNSEPIRRRRRRASLNKVAATERSTSMRGIGAGVPGTFPCPVGRTGLVGESSTNITADSQSSQQQAEQSNDAGDSAEAPQAPSKQVGVPAMEKAFIRSLAEMDAKIVAENRRLRPLLAHIPRPTLYGYVRGPPPSAGECLKESSTNRKKVMMGQKKTLVLDLDETLVSSSRTPCNCDYKIVFKIHSREKPDDHEDGDPSTASADASASSMSNKHGGHGKDEVDEEDDQVREIHYYVRLRPGLTKFLHDISAIYELVVWTASGQSYADAVIDLLDPTGELFARRLYRDSCIRHHNLCVKDLRRLGRPMNAVLLLDNYVYSFGLTLDNGVPISPWTGAKEAKASGLGSAYSLLRCISRFPDVRVPLVKAFDLHLDVHGHRRHKIVAPPPAAPASRKTRGSSSSSTSSSTSSSSRRRRRKGKGGYPYRTPLSPVHSCPNSSSSSPSPSASVSPSSSSGEATSVVLFSGRRVPSGTARRVAGGDAHAPLGVARRRRKTTTTAAAAAHVAGAPKSLSPVVAEWAANAQAVEEEERLAAQQQQHQEEEEEEEEEEEVESSTRSASSMGMRAKLTKQTKQSTRLKNRPPSSKHQQKPELTAAKFQLLQQAAVAAAAARALTTTTTSKMGTKAAGSGEVDGLKLSPVAARWAAEAESMAATTTPVEGRGIAGANVDADKCLME